MNKGELSRRYLLFLCAVFINAFSIALITKAMLGTSPISSVPFVLSLFTPWSMGLHTIFFNFLFIILEMLMMKRNEIREKNMNCCCRFPLRSVSDCLSTSRCMHSVGCIPNIMWYRY